MTTSHREEPTPAELEDMSQPSSSRAWRRSSTTSRSSTTRPSGRSRAPAPRSARSVRSRCGSSSPRCPRWRSSAATCSGRSSTWRPASPATWLYALYTPLIGGFFGLAVLALGIAVIAYVKKFFPDEVSIQQRHDGAFARDRPQDGDGAARRGGQGHRHRPAFADHPVGGRGGGAVRPRSRHRRDRAAGAQPVEGRPQGRAVDHGLGARPPRRGRLPARRHRHPGRDQAGPPGGPGRGLDADGLPVPQLRAGQPGGARGGAQARRQPHDAHPAASRHPGDPARRAGRTSTTATSTPTRRSAPTWAARPRCTRRRPSASSARATSRSSSRRSTPSRFSVPRLALYPNYRLP